MIIEINPLDTLFFRDGKPFSMGEETWADAIFPPSPSVIYGALRSTYFAYNIRELEKANEDDDPTKKMEIKSIYLKINDEIFFPPPLDLVKKKERENKAFTLEVPDKISEFISNSEIPQHLIYSGDENIENIPDGILNNLDFTEYLNVKSKEFSYLKLGDYLISEPKVGIGRSSNTHSTELGKLYRVDMKRLENKSNDKLSIVVEFEGLDIPEKGMLKLGGEGKAVSYKKFADSLKINFPKFDNNEKQFKLVLTTPAIFENGWIPKWINNNFKYEHNGLKLKLLTAAIGKPVHIGGFDMKKRIPKPMYKAIPAGSVYYFKLINGTIQDLKNKFHNKNISDIYSEQGFGHCFVGKYKMEE